MERKSNNKIRKRHKEKKKETERTVMEKTTVVGERRKRKVE